MNTKESDFNKTSICYCSFCGRECKNLNSLKQHETRCKNNPNRILSVGNKVGHPAWNKGKTKETDERVKKCGESYHKNYSEGKFVTWCYGKTKYTDEKLNALAKKSAETIKNKVESGDWHISFSKRRIIEYKGIKFHGEWEVNFAKLLDSKNIEWMRPNNSFKYFYEDKEHQYFPDFYLPEYDLYIEVKGYPTSRDFAKWNSFPKECKLDIYFGDELKSLHLVDEIKDVYKNVPQKYRNKHVELF